MGIQVKVRSRERLFFSVFQQKVTITNQGKMTHTPTRQAKLFMSLWYAITGPKRVALEVSMKPPTAIAKKELLSVLKIAQEIKASRHRKNSDACLIIMFGYNASIYNPQTRTLTVWLPTEEPSKLKALTCIVCSLMIFLCIHKMTSHMEEKRVNK